MNKRKDLLEWITEEDEETPENKRWELLVSSLVEKDIRTKTEISNEIKREQLARMHLLSAPFEQWAPGFKVKLIEDVLRNYYIIGYSLGRKSRKELVDIGKALVHAEANVKKGFFASLKEKLGGGE